MRAISSGVEFSPSSESARLPGSSSSIMNVPTANSVTTIAT
jgi:hypothetical protein